MNTVAHLRFLFSSSPLEHCYPRVMSGSASRASSASTDSSDGQSDIFLIPTFRYTTAERVALDHDIELSSDIAGPDFVLPSTPVESVDEEFEQTDAEDGPDLEAYHPISPVFQDQDVMETTISTEETTMDDSGSLHRTSY